MQRPSEIYQLIRAQGVRLFTGVPDSLLKDFCAYVTDYSDEDDHVITANEGNAVGLATGHFLATGSPALVYMQNSGTGNALNPLLSLADAEVYSIPMMLMIGWRGEPGSTDEPQHVKQGRVMIQLLNAMEIPWFVLDADSPDPQDVIAQVAAKMYDTMAPVALLVRKGTFEKYKLKKEVATDFPLNREGAVKCIVDLLGEEDVIISTTGMTSRELYEYRAARGDRVGNDFLTVGAMGHAASIAVGVACDQPARRVICLDGDGSVLMHMGGLAIVGQLCPNNFVHIIINNGAHDSVGGQPTAGFKIDLATIARASGYQHATTISSSADIEQAFAELQKVNGPVLLEVRVNKGSRADLGRPTSTPVENRNALMKHLGVY